MEYECLICCESDGKLLYKACNCNSYIHLECFEKLINTVPTHSTHCAVCKKRYSIKKTLTGFILSDFKKSYMIIIMDVLYFPIIGFTIFIINFHMSERARHYMIFIIGYILLFLIVSAVWFFSRYLYYIHTKSICYLKPVWKRSAVIFKKKNPKIVYFV